MIFLFKQDLPENLWSCSPVCTPAYPTFPVLSPLPHLPSSPPPPGRKNITAIDIHHEHRENVRLYDLDCRKGPYLFSSFSFTFLFLSATSCLPLSHFLWLFLFPKAFFENAEDEARHQNQDHHNNGSDRPHGNCRGKFIYHYAYYGRKEWSVFAIVAWTKKTCLNQIFMWIF